MRIYIFLFFTILSLSIACNSSTVHNSSSLSDEQLANIMLDMHFADALLAEFSGQQRDSISMLFWKQMTQLYGMSEKEIREEVRNLELDPEKMKLILGRVKEMADSIQ